MTVNYCRSVADSESGYAHFGHFSSFFGRGSEATKTSAPIAGVKNKEQKKYPQNPNFLFDPMKAIRIQRATYKR